MDYKSSGVDIEAGRDFVEKIKKKAPTIGGFNGMMKVPSRYKNPVLVSGTDGVGTKINICQVANDYTTIGPGKVDLRDPIDEHAKMHEMGIAHGHGGNKEAYEMSGKLNHDHEKS